jgi:hypothetical protein
MPVFPCIIKEKVKTSNLLGNSAPFFGPFWKNSDSIWLRMCPVAHFFLGSFLIYAAELSAGWRHWNKYKVWQQEKDWLTRWRGGPLFSSKHRTSALLSGGRIQGTCIYLDPRRVTQFSLDWLVADCNTLGGGRTGQ